MNKKQFGCVDAAGLFSVSENRTLLVFTQPKYRVKVSYAPSLKHSCANFQLFQLKNDVKNVCSLRFPGILTFCHFNVTWTSYLKSFDEFEFRA